MAVEFYQTIHLPKIQLKSIFFLLNLLTWCCCQSLSYYYTISAAMKCTPLDPGRCYRYHTVTFSLILSGFLQPLLQLRSCSNLFACPSNLFASLFFLFLRNIGKMGSRLYNLHQHITIFYVPKQAPCQEKILLGVWRPDRCHPQSPPQGTQVEGPWQWGPWARGRHRRQETVGCDQAAPPWSKLNSSLCPQNSSTNHKKKKKNYWYWPGVFPPDMFIFFWLWVGCFFF